MEIYRLVFSPIDVNTYIVAGKNGECAVIDCGCYDESEFRRLKNFLSQKNLKPVLLLNTHCHLDHVFGNRFMLSEWGLSSWFSELEERNRIDSPIHAMMFGLQMDLPPVAAGFLSHGDEKQFGDISFRALHVPGHTAGSLAYYCEASGCVFSGDALFAGSIGRTDLPGGNFETLTNSIRKNILSLPPDTVVYPGHGGETTVSAEAASNPYLSGN